MEIRISRLDRSLFIKIKDKNLKSRTKKANNVKIIAKVTLMDKAAIMKLMTMRMSMLKDMTRKKIFILEFLKMGSQILKIIHFKIMEIRV